MKKPRTGLLHLAFGWTIRSDMEDKLVILSWIVLSQLRSDIVSFSKMLKICIIIEPTCSYKKNMEVWHDKNFEKHESLSSSIKSNGWPVHFFTIEVGAGGHCSTTVKSCLSC